MITVKEIDLRIFDMHTRIPFRYGIVTLKACPHLFCKLTVDVDGRTFTGVSADHLPPKWFTKNPQSLFEDDLKDMIGLIRLACDNAVLAGPAADVYTLVSRVYHHQLMWGNEKGFPPLLCNFGVSLVERAVMEAFCKSRQATFHDAVRRNLFGLRFSGFADEHLMLDETELGETTPAHWLPEKPLDSIIARHTVGLVDHLTDDQIPAAERVDDGLPQSLVACIKRYGLRHFKLKIAGDVEKDRERLRQIAAIIQTHVKGQWAITIDGNENYKQIGPFIELWESLQSDDTLRTFLERLIFVEQPLHRDVALSDQTKADLMGWKARPPVIIDESDGFPGALRQALECGYVGTSHKNCKGIFKGIANACVISKLRWENPKNTYVISGEDLSNVGPVALLQDLAVCATLGIASVERNGQHYFKGMAMHSQDLQQTMLKSHPDLFHQHTRGFATLDIRDGLIDVRSINAAALGVGFELDCAAFTPLNRWTFQG